MYVYVCVRTVSGIKLGSGSYLSTQYARALALSAANNCTCLPKIQIRTSEHAMRYMTQYHIQMGDDINHTL